MKIIFLDLDGVINSYDPVNKRALQPSPECVENLNRITDATGARIVVSSTWRQMGHEKIARQLRDWGVTGCVIGTTPYEHRWHGDGLFLLPKYARRCDEITHWLSNPLVEVEAWIVIDDEDHDLETVKDRLVKTKYVPGLTEADAEHAISMLSPELTFFKR